MRMIGAEIPSNPWETYKNAGWNGFADWLGKKRPVDLSRANDMAFLNPHRPRIQIEEMKIEERMHFILIRIATREQFWICLTATQVPRHLYLILTKEEKYRLTIKLYPMGKARTLNLFAGVVIKANMQSCAQAQINSIKSPFSSVKTIFE